VIELFPAVNAGEDEVWRLELSDDEVRLFDDHGEVAMKFGRHRANTQITFPSFWLSVKHLQFLDGISPKYQFHPDKKALARIRAYLNKALREDPRARKQLKLRGLGWVLIGLLCTSGGTGFFGFLWATNDLTWPGGRFKKIAAISIVVAVVGIGLMIRGLAMFVKAARMDRP
jgi:hypothetical protein